MIVASILLNIAHRSHACSRRVLCRGVCEWNGAQGESGFCLVLSIISARSYPVFLPCDFIFLFAILIFHLFRGKLNNEWCGPNAPLLVDARGESPPFSCIAPQPALSLPSPCSTPLAVLFDSCIVKSFRCVAARLFQLFHDSTPVRVESLLKVFKLPPSTDFKWAERPSASPEAMDIDESSSVSSHSAEEEMMEGEATPPRQLAKPSRYFLRVRCPADTEAPEGRPRSGSQTSAMLNKIVEAKRGGRRKKRPSNASVHNTSLSLKALAMDGSVSPEGRKSPENNHADRPDAPSRADGDKKDVDTKKKVLRNNTSNNKRRVKNQEKAGEGSHKITEFFPVRRSERKTTKQLEEEESAQMYEAIYTGSCEDDLDIYEDDLKGRGIRSTRVYKKNELVIEYKGDMIDYDEAKQRESKYSDDPSIGSYMYFFKHHDKQWCVDATKESKYKGRLVNHSALRPNLKTKVVEFAGRHHLILVARRDIEEGEELLYDYGDRTAATVAQNPWLINS